MKLENQVALITGAATGIGREIALTFAREGASVVVNYSQSEDEARETMEQCRAMCGRAMIVRADVSQSDQVKAMVQEVLAKFGRIDVLVNNAGMTIPRSFAELTEDVWDRVIDVNLKGVFLCTQPISKIMLEQKKGSIINVSSVAAITTSGSSAAYVVAKAGVIVLTQYLARELAPYVRVNCISPGYTETRWHKTTSAESKTRMIENTPLKEAGTPQHMAKAALFFAADADHVTGQNLVIDGGSFMWRP